MPSGFFHFFNTLDSFICYIRGVWLVFIISCFVEISELNANSVDPDQTPRSAASDLGLHCLPMSHLWETRLIWVNLYSLECNFLSPLLSALHKLPLWKPNICSRQKMNKNVYY